MFEDYEYQNHERVRNIQVTHKDIKMSQDFNSDSIQIKQEAFLNVSSQEYDYQNQQEQPIFHKTIQRLQDKKNETHISRMIGLYCKEKLGQSMTATNMTNMNITREKQQLLTKMEETIIPDKKDIRVNLYNKPNQLKCRNQKLKAEEKMLIVVEARQKGLKAPTVLKPTRLQTNQNDIQITDKAVLFALLPQKKNKANIVPDKINEKYEITPNKIKELFVDISSMKKASQEINIQNINITINEIKVIVPILVCKGIESDSGRLTEFIYRPGFESELQRNELSQSKLDFDFAEKPQVGGKYIVYFRTFNTQQQIVAEKIEKIL